MFEQVLIFYDKLVFSRSPGFIGKQIKEQLFENSTLTLMNATEYKAPNGFYMRNRSTFFLLNNEAIVMLFISTSATYLILSLFYTKFKKTGKTLKKANAIQKKLIKMKEDL